MRSAIRKYETVMHNVRRRTDTFSIAQVVTVDRHSRKKNTW